jgi:ribosomal protein L37AE/L43A
LYEGDCPPGLSTAIQAEKLGFSHSAWRVGEIRECVNCPLCQNLVSATKTKDGIQCNGCEKELKTNGKIIDLKAKKEVARAAISHVHNTPTKPKKSPKLVVKMRINFGGATKQVFDQKGNLIAEGCQAEKLLQVQED